MNLDKTLTYAVSLMPSLQSTKENSSQTCNVIFNWKQLCLGEQISEVSFKKFHSNLIQSSQLERTLCFELEVLGSLCLYRSSLGRKGLILKHLLQSVCLSHFTSESDIRNGQNHVLVIRIWHLGCRVSPLLGWAGCFLGLCLKTRLGCL